MIISKKVIFLSLAVVTLAIIATGIGLFYQDSGSPFPFTTLRGDTVQIYGQGLYRYDTLFSGAGFKGQDTVTLFIGIPLLLAFTMNYCKGTERSKILLSSILAYFLYAYLSMSFSAAYNSLFLISVVLFAMSFYAFLLVFTSINLSKDVLGRLPRRGPAAFMLVGGLLTLAVWLTPLITALIEGRAPDLLDSYTTPVTYALDLAIITPCTLISAFLIWKRDELGYRIACSLLGIIILLLPFIAISTVFQIKAGVVFSPGEIIGPIIGFIILGTFALWVMGSILRNVKE